MTTLVTYATKYGSTQEVAETIAASLRQQGIQVELLPVREVNTLSNYSEVVLGAAIYAGRWHKDARKFLRQHHATLVNLPVAIFALGPLSDDEKAWQGARAQLDQTLARFSWLTPIAVKMFGGVIDPSKLHFPFNHMPAGDKRDWEAIRTWANELGTSFSSPTTLKPVLENTTPANITG